VGLLEGYEPLVVDKAYACWNMVGVRELLGKSLAMHVQRSTVVETLTQRLRSVTVGRI
jgi:hypothetical protein